MPTISRSKGNQIMKLGQLIEYLTRQVFPFKNNIENEAGRLVSDPLNEVKASSLQRSFNIFR